MSNTTDTKKYRLLKDISMPYRSIKAGTVGDCIEPHEYISFGEGVNSLSYSIKDIKNKPDWFEEVLPVSEPVKERIKVYDLHLSSRSDKETWYNFLVKGSINSDKYGTVLQAIESVLNGDTVVEDKVKNFGIFSAPPLIKMYSQSEVDTIRREAFNAARENDLSAGSWLGHLQTKQGAALVYKTKYPTLSDYLSSLNSKETEQPTNDNAYQTLLPDCDCKSGGIIMYKNKPVCRWCRKPYGHGGMINYLPEHFKQSKQSAPLTATVLNKQPAPEPSALPTKEWEIKSFIHNRTMDIVNINDGFAGTERFYTTDNYLNDPCNSVKSGDYSIHSVRRLSDNVVFSVGDMVTYKNVPAHSWEKGNGCLISYFKVSGEDIYINSHDAGETLHDISEWIKLSPEPSPIQEDKPKLGDKALYNTLDTCYNEAIDNAIEIVQSEQKNFPLSFSVYSEAAVKKIITSLTNLKKKRQ